MNDVQNFLLNQFNNLQTSVDGVKKDISELAKDSVKHEQKMDDIIRRIGKSECDQAADHQKVQESIERLDKKIEDSTNAIRTTLENRLDAMVAKAEVNAVGSISNANTDQSVDIKSDTDLTRVNIGQQGGGAGADGVKSQGETIKWVSIAVTAICIFGSMSMYLLKIQL